MVKGKIHVITTGKQQLSRVSEIIQSVHPYVDAIHIREKTKTAKELFDFIHQLKACDVPLSKIIINDRVDVAYACKTLGVQLAGHSLPVANVKEMFPNLKVGCSCHTTKEAIIAEKHGADYILYGHIFETQSKQGLRPKGLAALARMTEHVQIPVIAIGGIKPEHIDAVMETGVDGIAVMSGVFEAENPLHAVRSYANKLR